MFCLLLLTIIFLCSVIYLAKRVTIVKGVGLFPGWLPLVGHGLSLIRIKDLFSFIKDLGTQSIKNGGIVAFQLGWKPLYIITNPEDATTILTRCLEKMFVYKLIDPLFGDTLVSAEGAVWKRNRRILDQAFKQNILESYIHVFNNQASCLVNALAQKLGEGYVDVTDEVERNVLETTCHTTMGLRGDGENFVNDRYVTALHKVFEIVALRVQKQWLMIDVIFNRSNQKKKLDESLNIIHETSTKMVQIRKSEYSERLKQEDGKYDDEEINSFLHIMIENNTTSEGSIFTDHQLRCLCDNVLLAGFDTSTNELLFTLACFGSDDGVQEKIYKEIIEVLGEETVVTREHLTKLIYLEAAIKEALRLYPIGPIVAREATADIQLGKVIIPAGSSIAIHLWAINRHKAYWGLDAEEFNPGRWLNPETLPEHPNAFASFSFGRRNCIGKHYAMTYVYENNAGIYYEKVSYHLKPQEHGIRLLYYAQSQIWSSNEVGATINIYSQNHTR